MAPLLDVSSKLVSIKREHNHEEGWKGTASGTASLASLARRPLGPLTHCFKENSPMPPSCMNRGVAHLLMFQASLDIVIKQMCLQLGLLYTETFFSENHITLSQ